MIYSNLEYFYNPIIDMRRFISNRFDTQPINHRDVFQYPPDYEDTRGTMAQSFLPDELRRHINPIFTRQYLRNLIRANNYRITPELIQHIKDLHPNLNFEEIHHLYGAFMPRMLYWNVRDPDNPSELFPTPPAYQEAMDEVSNQRRQAQERQAQERQAHQGEGLKRHHKTNRWIAHVKAYSKKHNVPYHLAIKQAKAPYR